MIPFKICSLLILLTHIDVHSIGQTILPNTCDSTILTKEELRKCRLDSAWTTKDISIKVNYIAAFKTQLLPKYKSIRNSISVPQELLQQVRELKKVYDSVLDGKTDQYEKDMDKNQLYVQPKAYIHSLLSFQLFKFYPDVYAILLNGVHLELRPVTSQKELYKRMFDHLVESIPATLNEQLSKITIQMKADENKLPQEGVIRVLQGMIAEDYRRQCDIVNFLMWTE